MKKLLVLIVAISFTLNCSAAGSVRFPIFKGKKHKRESRMVRCGSKDNFKKGRKQVIKHVAGMAVLFVIGGIAMESK